MSARGDRPAFKSRPAPTDEKHVKAILGLLVAALFVALFAGAGGDALRGHVSLLIGAGGGLVIAVRGLAGSSSS